MCLEGHLANLEDRLVRGALISDRWPKKQKQGDAGEYGRKSVKDAGFHHDSLSVFIQDAIGGYAIQRSRFVSHGLCG